MKNKNGEKWKRKKNTPSFPIYCPFYPYVDTHWLLYNTSPPSTSSFTRAQLARDSKLKNAPTEKHKMRCGGACHQETCLLLYCTSTHYTATSSTHQHMCTIIRIANKPCPCVQSLSRQANNSKKHDCLYTAVCLCTRMVVWCSQLVCTRETHLQYSSRFALMRVLSSQ